MPSSTNTFTFARPTSNAKAISTKKWDIPNVTEHQLAVLSELLNSDARVCRLIGSAGVGKSHTTSAFIEYCLRNKISIALTGTTHASVAVLQSMVPERFHKLVQASTIHSYLGMNLVGDGKGGDKLIKQKNARPKPPVQFLICDEVSMLTSDLMVYLKEAKITDKIILVGDPVQLSLPSSANLDRYPAYELTVNMRQDESRSDLKDYLTSLRKLIESNSKTLPALPARTSANIIVHDDHCSFMKAYKASTSPSKVFACFMNKTVKTYNTNVKKFIVESEEMYTIGDIVQPTAPIIIDGRMVIPNRAICTVEQVMDCDEFYSLLTNKGVIDVPKGKTTFNNHLQYLADERNWKEYYATKERFSHVHHLYAATSHSLQGTSVEEVFVDVADLKAILQTGRINDFLRILYVAMSRASQTVHLVDTSTRVYKCLGSYMPRTMKEISNALNTTPTMVRYMALAYLGNNS